MSVIVRPSHGIRGGWIVDIKTRLANGQRYRERRRLIRRNSLQPRPNELSLGKTSNRFSQSTATPVMGRKNRRTIFGST